MTVLMMWRSWNRTRPPVALRSEAGRFSLSTPVMVILGSLGCNTITTASMSGMVIQVSSPKHLEQTYRREVMKARRVGSGLTDRDVNEPADPAGHGLVFRCTTTAAL